MSKYEYTTAPKKEQRQRFNRMVEDGIDGIGKKLSMLTPQFVFNFFTGLGGLHGLKVKDYENFHEYTEAKKEIEFGQFFTPPPLCEAIVNCLKPEPKWLIADYACGSGNFFNYLPTEKNCYGIEIEDVAYKVCKALYPEAKITQGSFVDIRCFEAFDLVVGNPPFNLKTPHGISQYVFLRKAGGDLKPGQFLAFIAPKAFLEDEYTNKNKWFEIAEQFDFICQSELKGWFDVDIDIKVLFFQRKGVNPTNKLYCNEYIDFNPEVIYKDYIEPLKVANMKDKARLRLLQKAQAPVIPCYTRDIDKWMYHLKHQKDLRKRYYERALEKQEQLKQKDKPPEMTWAEWDKIRLTPEKFAAWLKSKVKKQYEPKARKLVKLVRTQYGFKYKAYSRALKEEERYFPDYVWLRAGTEFTGFVKLCKRKKAEYEVQNQAYSLMHRNATLDKFLSDFRLHDQEAGLTLFQEPEVIRLNEKQHHDLGYAFQKKYAVLAWQQGSGKSVAGMAWIDYVRTKVKHVFIVAPSLAVQLTWKPRLTKYGYSFKVLEQISDLEDIKPRQIILVSFDMVRILQRHIKRFVKRLGYKFALLADESDELTNIASARTRATLKCFRRGKYKLLTTGTTTRNNINELYPQLELLYNNSENFISYAPTIFRADKDNDLQEQPNDKFLMPYPAWYGHNLFKYSFCPQRTTVFGVKQDTQDVYNAEVLRDIIARTIITRTFDDIVGKKIYKIKNHAVLQGSEEKRLYSIIIEEFMRICYTYFQSSGNSRKEQMLRLMRQIKLLIDATSTPHLFPHYESKELPMKFYHINGLLKEWNDEKVAIGTVTIKASQEYNRFVAAQFPQRKLFYVDGGNSFASRKKIIKEFQATDNGILISTQQSLKSSVDIETCDKCIIESMQWNIPKMSQYFFRFIRYNSKKEKEVHFVSYADTIEQNILALLMAKEKLNEFVKTMEQKDRKDIYEEFDIDTGILDQIIEKEYDEEGHLHLRWGKQKLLN